MTRGSALVATVAVTLSACAGGTSISTPSGRSGPQATAGAATVVTAPHFGDGRVATTPTAAMVDACQAPTRRATSAPAEPWIKSDGSWDAAARPLVPGSVRWPQAHATVTLDAADRQLATNDLPVGGTSGIFPVAGADPAFAYDAPHRAIVAQAITMTVQADPVSRDIPACLPTGAIGVLTNGVLLYSALDGAGNDTVAHEVVDSCGGRPDTQGVYHYDTVTSCIPAAAPIPAVSPDHASLAGYAVDGFGIFVERDSAGALLTNRDLDACHGRISWVPWDGRIALMYHYAVTAEFPYTVGCLRGTGSGNAWDNHDPNT